jgi:hypothetical protein
MRSQDEFNAVTQLIVDGLNDCQISRLTAIPRSTIREWRRGQGKSYQRALGPSGKFCDRGHDFAALPGPEYSYLLGMYLGDGYVAAGRRGVYCLRVTCDVSYPQIIEECRDAMQSVLPQNKARLQVRSDGCVEVQMWSKHWPCLFPQHGPGRKHKRSIRLLEWQQDIVRQEAKMFLRGLIHSDGCRVVANDRGVASARYHFSNRSNDIKDLFCASLDQLSIPWTRPSDRDIAIYRKAATARLDEFIGPKR